MTLAIGDTAPDFEADTTEGKIRLHDWLGNSWGMLFSHPLRPRAARSVPGVLCPAGDGNARQHEGRNHPGPPHVASSRV